MTVQDVTKKPATNGEHSDADAPVDGEAPPAAGRAIPHDIDAEESLLGAMMLTQDAIKRGGDIVEAADFYRPAHRYVFDAITNLYSAGRPVDLVNISTELERAGKLDEVGGKKEHQRIEASTPASANAWSYALTIGELAAMRRTLFFARDLREAAFAVNIPEVDRLLEVGPETVLAHLADAIPPPPPIDVLDMKGEEERPRDWIVHRLLVGGDRVLISGLEGGGKTTFVRQFGIQLAAGIHPFTLDSITARRVMHFDFQDSNPQSEREFVKLRDRVGDRIHRGYLVVHHRRQGMDILKRADHRWFETAIAKSGAEVVTFGPLSKIFRAGPERKKQDEEIAEEVTGRLDEIGQKYGVAFIIEAHSPHGSNDDRADFRPKGASWWLQWPEFGFGMKPIPGRKATDSQPAQPSPGIFLRRFRGDRDRDRDWPGRLLYGRSWPWEAPPEDVL